MLKGGLYPDQYWPYLRALRIKASTRDFVSKFPLNVRSWYRSFNKTQTEPGAKAAVFGTRACVMASARAESPSYVQQPRGRRKPVPLMLHRQEPSEGERHNIIIAEVDGGGGSRKRTFENYHSWIQAILSSTQFYIKVEWKENKMAASRSIHLCRVP